MNTELLTNIIKQFIPFAQKQIGFKDPPRLFLRNDAENAENPFGKTAFYDPEAKSVTLYITGRHPKDVLRSLGHELVHHKQNCDGQFDNAGEAVEGYAQTNPHLRQMEMDANRDGSMCLRDFEDKLKKENTIYYEHLQKGENKMSTKDWKNKEIGSLISEAWGFKFNSLDEFNEFNGEGELQAEAEGDEEIEELAQARQAGDRRKPHKREPVRDDEEKMDEGDEEEDTLDEGEEEELDEQSKSDLADRGASRAAGGRRLDEEDDEELEEAAKPDYIDIDGDGDKEESMKDAAEDKKEKKEKNESVDALQEAIANLLRKHLRG